MRVLLAAALLVPAVMGAQSPWDGTWKADLSTSKFSQKPEVLVLMGGRYTCRNCVPPEDVKSDGTDQTVAGSPYFDTLAVTVTGESSARFTYKKDGKVVNEMTSTVSADGTQLLDDFTSYPAAGPPVKGSGRRTRVAAGPEGAHRLSGSWRIETLEQISDSALTWTFKSTEGGLGMRAMTGESYDAMFDGTDVPIKGDRGGSTVSLRRVGDDTIEETTKRNGKVVGIGRYTIAADGKSIRATYEDKERDTTLTYVAHKQ